MDKGVQFKGGYIMITIGCVGNDNYIQAVNQEKMNNFNARYALEHPSREAEAKESVMSKIMSYLRKAA